MKQDFGSIIPKKAANLNDLLLSAGIKPLDPKMVHDYMAKELAKCPKKTFMYALLSWFEPAFMGLFFVGVVSSAIGAITILLGVFGFAKIWVGVAMFFTSLVILIPSLAIVVVADMFRLRIYDQARWQASAFDDFKQLSTPKQVVDLALKAVITVPQSSLTLYDLIQNSQSLDPVLEIRRGKETTYLAIWKDKKVLHLA